MFEKLVMMSDESSGVSEWTADYGSMKKKTGFKAVVLYWSDLPCLPPLPWWMSGDAGKGVPTGIYWVEARDAAKPPTGHRADFTTKNCRAPNVNSEKPGLGWFEGMSARYCFTGLFQYPGFSLWSQLFSHNYFQWVWFQLFQNEWSGLHLVHFCWVDGWFAVMQ